MGRCAPSCDWGTAWSEDAAVMGPSAPPAPSPAVGATTSHPRQVARAPLAHRGTTQLRRGPARAGAPAPPAPRAPAAGPAPVRPRRAPPPRPLQRALLVLQPLPPRVVVPAGVSPIPLPHPTPTTPPPPPPLQRSRACRFDPASLAAPALSACCAARLHLPRYTLGRQQGGRPERGSVFEPGCSSRCLALVAAGVGGGHLAHQVLGDRRDGAPH